MNQNQTTSHVRKPTTVWPEPPAILRSENYHEFKYKNNRDLDQRNLAKLRKLADQGKFTPHKAPILVDRHFHIKDGQHRFTICQEKGIPVYYIVDQDDITPEEIMDLNQAGKAHTVIDRLRILKESQTELGAEVRRAWSFWENHAKEYKLSQTLITQLLFNFGSGVPVGNALLDKTFRVNCEKETLRFLEWLHELPKGAALKYDKAFLAAVLAIGKACGDMELAYTRILNQAKKITAEPNTAAYKSMLLNLYNHGRQDRNKLKLKKVTPRFEDEAALVN